MLPEDEHTEEDKANELEARIKAPIVWARLESGLRIEDLQEKRYEEALALIKEHFLDDEVTFKSIGLLQDGESVIEFLANTKIQMKDKASLVAVEEESGDIIAVLVMRIFDKVDFSRTFNRVKEHSGRCLAAIMRYYDRLEAPVSVHESFGCKQYLRIFTAALHRDRRVDDILETEMYKAAMRSALAWDIDVISGIFTSHRAQQIAEGLGFEKLSEIFYKTYEDGSVFEAKSPNYGAALMAARISRMMYISEDDDDKI